MNFVLLYWREALIAILAGSCFFSVRSCESAHDKVIQIQTEDRALADQAQHESEQRQAHDKQEYDDAKQDFEKQIADLSADHRVASVQCVRNRAASSSPVPAATASASGTPTEARSDISREATFDPGPDLDALTRECDRLAVEHNKLIDWLLATR